MRGSGVIWQGTTSAGCIPGTFGKGAILLGEDAGVGSKAHNWASLVSLLDKAKAVATGTRILARDMDDDELELLLAYLNGEVIARQVAEAMTMARQNVEHWAARRLKQALSARRVKVSKVRS